MDSPTATGHPSTSSRDSATANERNMDFFPCCTNRTAIIVGNVFRIVAMIMVSLDMLFGQSAHSANEPNDLERKIWMMVNLSIAGLAIWGAVSYRTWPVMIQLGWQSISILLSFRGDVSLFLDQLLIGTLLDIFLFWMPMFWFVVEYHRHPYEAVRLNVTDDDREIEML